MLKFSIFHLPFPHMKLKQFLVVTCLALSLPVSISILRASDVDFLSSNSTNSLSTSETNASSQKKLIFAVDIIRHGDRTPLIPLSTVSYRWEEGLGELTQLGSNQEFFLGQQLRERYITQSHLLPNHYIPETLYARSTDFDRTIMSGSSVLAGLYFDTTSINIEGYPIIPIHNCPLAQENLLIPDNNVVFDFHHLFQTVILPSQEWQEKEKSLQHNFKRWSLAVGAPINTLYDLKDVGNTLFIDQLHQVPIPQGLTDEDVDTIINTAQWITCTVFQNKIIAQTAAANLLQEIYNTFQTATQPNSPLRYRLYSAHETTLLVLLTALGANELLTSIPPYASDLNLELFDEGNGHYTAQVMLYTIQNMPDDQPPILTAVQENSYTLKQLKDLSQKALKQLKKVQALQLH